MASTLTALDVINGALLKAGFDVTTDNRAGTSGDYGNKAYYLLLESINVLTEQLLPDASWNEPETATTIAAAGSTITLAARVNPNIIHWVAIDAALTRLARTTRQRLVSEVWPGFADPATQAKPSYWYVQDESLKLWPTSDATYTITYGYQNLPQTFTSSTLSGTTLDISDASRALLINLLAVRFLRMLGNHEYAQILWNETENMNNPYSLIRITRSNNKLTERIALQRVRLSPSYSMRNFI